MTSVDAKASEASELIIYSSAEADHLRAFLRQFSNTHPGIKIHWIRDSCGLIQARMMAEQDNPRHDVFFGHAVTDLMALDEMEMFLPYAPRDIEKLDIRYRDKKALPTWTGLWGVASAICFNTIEARKKRIPKPVYWSDLCQPIYKGQITMPNPLVSGTGFLNLAGWVQIMSYEEAWSFMDKLHVNIVAYAGSGFRTCNQVASGEYAVGISLPTRAADLKTQGAPIETVVPKNGIGWEMQGVAIMQTTKNLAAAKTFVDWAVSSSAMENYASRLDVVAYPVTTSRRENLPADVTIQMITNDFTWAAANKRALLEEWRVRYNGKAEVRHW